jgi:hypothetical protein
VAELAKQKVTIFDGLLNQIYFISPDAVENIFEGVAGILHLNG